MLLLAAGEPGRALNALDRGVKAGTTCLCFAAQIPYFVPLRGNPRLRRILQALKLDRQTGVAEPRATREALVTPGGQSL